MEELKAFDMVKADIAEIIEEARNGNMFILVDDEDRENEGDLVVPAQMATPSAINFMATYGRGLICLTLNRERVESLDLPLMAQRNESRHSTNFTVSIEAKEGISTGISAPDRALTVATAIDPTKGAEDIVSPGHIFPLLARDGGTLERTGHTEAAVDIARLAGLYPAGVICEIMNEDGTMARRDDLVGFAQRHGLKLGTIADLIAYRLKNDSFVEPLGEDELFDSRAGGSFRRRSYRNSLDGAVHHALIKGDIDASSPTLVRMHALSIDRDVLGISTEKIWRLVEAQRIIENEGEGVLVLMNPTSGMGSEQLEGVKKIAGGDQNGRSADGDRLLSYGVGAQILRDLGIKQMELLTDAPRELAALAGYGLEVVGTRPLNPDNH
ncbi:MAG: 3,4-dihydroxy-2-butanone-4-phosphate synthase [Alphaproteobacteria bacterium]